MGEGRRGLSKAYVIEAAEASLRRLGTDVIDLYQSHFDDPDTPVAETLEAYEALIRAGKVRAVGASNFGPARLAEALEAARARGLPRYECLQPQHNLHDRAEFEGSLAPLCAREGLGVITYYSLASGFLTGKYRRPEDAAGRPRGERAARYLDVRGRRILAALDAVAEAHGASPAQVALAWLMARPGITAPIASATTPEQLDDLTAATRLALGPDDVAALDRASAYEA
jgi:aryl-alcohol dehydrogenase-like predicted oxidoreductase